MWIFSYFWSNSGFLYHSFITGNHGCHRWHNIILMSITMILSKPFWICYTCKFRIYNFIRITQFLRRLQLFICIFWLIFVFYVTYYHFLSLACASQSPAIHDLNKTFIKFEKGVDNHHIWKYIIPGIYNYYAIVLAVKLNHKRISLMYMNEPNVSN